MLDNYRNTLLRRKEELAKLNQELAKEQAKIAPLQRKILSAQDSIRRTSSASTQKSKLGEIDRANKSISDTQKKIGDIQAKIARKEAEIATAEKNYRNEEAKENKKHSDEEKKRLREADRQSEELQRRLRHNELLQARMQEDIALLQAVPDTITVLFLAANPNDTPQLRLDEEARAISQKIRMSDYRDSVRFETRWATRSSDILQAINETSPTIVHFSGHGTEDGSLVLLNPDGTHKVVSKNAISAAMATASDTIRLVVFNACFSEAQAEEIVEYIEAAIGMSVSISDEAACTFAAQFYSAIGFGLSLKKAFGQAVAALMLEGIPEESTPKLYIKDSVDADEIILVQP